MLPDRQVSRFPQNHMAPFAPSAGARVLLRRLLSTTTKVTPDVAHPVAKKVVSEAALSVASEAAHPVAKDANKVARSVSKKVASEAAHPVANKAAHPVAEDTKKDGRLLYGRLWALGNAREGSVSRVMNKWVRQGRETHTVHLEKHVMKLRKSNRHAQALELMDWMVRTKDITLSYTNHAIRLDLIHKVHGIEAAEKYFDGLPDPAKNHQTYGALLNCYCSSEKEEKATDLYHKMVELDILSSILLINNLMSLYMKIGQHKKVASLFEWMKAKNINGNTLTCCVVMTSYAALNKIDAVEEILKEMEEKDVALRWSAYRPLASIYVSAGLVEKAEPTLKKLEGLVQGRDGREPFHFLMGLYASLGNLSEVNRVWDMLKATFPKVTNTSYLSILQALYKLSDTGRMKQIFEEWESNRRYYDVRLANMMTQAHLKNGMAKDAELLWEEAKEKSADFETRDLFITCELFLGHYIGMGDMISALNWVENATKLPKKAGKLDQEKIHKFTKYFEEQKDVKGAERFCSCLRTLGCIDGKAYESLLRTYLAAGETNRSLFQQIKDDKIEVCHTIGKLLKRMGDRG